MTLSPSVRSCSDLSIYFWGEERAGLGQCRVSGFYPLFPLVTIKSVETVIKVLQHILMPRLGPHPSGRARLITSSNTRRKKTLRKENFVHCNKTMWSVMRLGSEIGQFVSMFIGYIQLCLWFMKLRIVFLRVAGTGNKMVAFYIRRLDIRKMGMFQFEFKC